MLGRVMGGLIVVLVLVGLTARIARRARGNKGSTGLRVVDRVGLSRDANLAVVEVSNRMLLLGVTSQGVTMLADLDDAGHRDARHAGPAHLQHAQHLETDQQPGTTRHPDPRLSTDPPVPPVSQAVADLALESTTPSAIGPATPVPTAVALGDHPDLASALRAAGRTADSTTAPARAVDPATAGAQEHESPGTPQTRTETRSRAPSRGRGWLPRQRTAAGTTSIPRATRADRTKRTVPQPRAQASGSVLSPRTWRQGLEALRELTVRR
jgi:flagellar biogenesis protein FliO